MKPRPAGCLALALLALGGAIMVADCRALRGRAEPEAARADGAPRIVSFVPAATEMLFALGLGSNVVGRSRFCDWPPEAAGLPVAGDLLTLDERRVAALAPTHAVVYASDAQGQAPLLRALGAEPVEGRTEGAASIVAFADRLGDLFPGRTNGFAAGPWRAEMLAIAAAPPPPPGAPRALVAVSHPDAPWTDAFAAGGDTFYDEVLRAAGLSNALSTARGYPRLTPERMLALAPEIVFDVLPPGMGAPAGGDYWSFLPPDVRVVPLRDSAAVRPRPRPPPLRDLLRAAVRPPSDE